jgi:hypothetical protein
VHGAIGTNASASTARAHGEELNRKRGQPKKEETMSWSKSVQGTHDEAKAQIAADQSVPQSMKDALAPILAEFSPEKHVSVSTYGHHDGAGGGNATITVTTI